MEVSTANNSFLKFWPCIDQQSCRGKLLCCLNLRRKKKKKNDEIRKKHLKNATDKRGHTKTSVLGEEFEERPKFQVQVPKGWSQTSRIFFKTLSG